MRYFITHKAILFLILGFVWIRLCSVENIAIAQTAEIIAEKTKESTVLLEMEDANGRSSQGSGFYVGERLVATNFHVINGAKRGTVKLVSRKFISKQERFEIQGPVALDKTHDLALVKVMTLNAPPLPLGNSDNVKYGETVYAVGNPRGFEGTFSSGEISNIQSRGTARIKDKVLQFTAPISRGSSGGAVVNRYGQVIGIVSETRDDGQNLNFAVPVNALKTLLATVNPAQPVQPFPDDEKFRSGRKQLPYILVFIFMSLVVFFAVWFLPLVKIDHLKIAALVAIGFGTIRTFFTAIVRSDSFPVGIKSFLASKPPKDIVHALGCEDCIVDLISYSIKLPTYIVFIAFLLGFTNLVVRQFELNGFFKTYFVAMAIVSGEYLLYLLLTGL